MIPIEPPPAVMPRFVMWGFCLIAGSWVGSLLWLSTH